MKIDELKALIRELIKTELEEASTMGSGASVTSGAGEAYAAPLGYKRKRKSKIK